MRPGVAPLDLSCGYMLCHGSIVLVSYCHLTEKSNFSPGLNKATFKLFFP